MADSSEIGRSSEQRGKDNLLETSESSCLSENTREHQAARLAPSPTIKQATDPAKDDRNTSRTVWKPLADLNVNAECPEFVLITCNEPDDSADSDDSAVDSPDNDSSDECRCDFDDDTDEPSEMLFGTAQSAGTATGDRHPGSDAYWSENCRQGRRSPDVIYFRGLEKLDGIARAIAETQRTNRLPDHAIVGPFSYVDVFSDPDLEPTVLRMTADELEASVDPVVLHKYLHGLDDDDNVDVNDAASKADRS